MPDPAVEPERLYVLFGTQTGNAKDVADRIGREARRRGKKAQIMAMDAFDLVSHQEERCKIIFVASTTGQGEVPSNMRQFWRLIMRKSLPANLLKPWNYAIFGLGDSGYIDYNVVAKKLDRRLAGLGATQMVSRGLGDDQQTLGYEAALEPWLSSLWTHLNLAPTSAAVLDTPNYRVSMAPPEQLSNGACKDRKVEAVRAAHDFNRLEAAAAGLRDQHKALTEPLSGTISEFGPGSPCLARLQTNTRITAADHFQDTRHIELNLGKDGPQFDPGDILCVFPSQSEDAIARLLDQMGLDPNCRVTVSLSECQQEASDLSLQARLEDFIRGALDIDSASPRRYFFEVLQHFASDDLQRERLEHFASAEGREDLNLYNESEASVFAGRTVLEVLQDFGSAMLPLEWLIQVCPRLQPRQFSIANSLKAHPREAHITLAVVDYRTPYKRRKRGLCSTWLANAHKGEIVPVWVEKGVLHLPEDPSKPIVMIGPGTGIAPFRAFLEERQLDHRAGQSVGPSYLYFGCRGQTKDFYYQGEFEAMVRDGTLAPENGLQVAFSRDQQNKIYVQDLLNKNRDQVYNLICKGAYVYVSGSAEKMPQEVANVFRESVLQQAGSLSPADAEKTMRLLSARDRYIVEAWS